MAERRMFAKKIVSSARFLRMPATARLLYYDLGMYADDDGIVEAFMVLQMTHATIDDLHILAARAFIQILNDDMVSYICDWRINNFIRKDRYSPSLYQHLVDWSAAGQPTRTHGEESGEKEKFDANGLDVQGKSGEMAVLKPCSVRYCFIDAFGREPDTQFMSTILKLQEKGMTEEEIVTQIRQSTARNPRNPEAYILAMIKQLEWMREEQGIQEEPLDQWELDWLESIRLYQAKMQEKQEGSN